MSTFSTHIRLAAILMTSAVMAACTPGRSVKSDEYPPIFPDYTEVTVPAHMAPLVFKMTDGRKFTRSSRMEGNTEWISVKAWNKGDREAVEYRPFPVYKSDDPIDPYVAYRLIEPGYESWHDISITQRELASFKEIDIVDNRANGKGCMNCHTFQNGNPDDMLFHARGAGGGTVFIRNGEARIINLAQTGPKRQGVYPAWHPSGRYVAFSSNSTHQCFSINHSQQIEVYDDSSDIILMDLENDSVVVPEALSGDERFETFPCWSEDGATLYFCSAESVENVGRNRGKVHYCLMSIAFEDGQFVGEPKLLYSEENASVSFPRAKNGIVLFTRSAFGTFPVWHKEADLWTYNPQSGEVSPASELNSDDTESYHSWSSNGKWVVFGSRRLDGRYTRLYFAHYDGDGHFSKPFLLPQEDPELNTLRLKSYNIPEFVKGEVAVHQEAVSKLFQ